MQLINKNSESSTDYYVRLTHKISLHKKDNYKSGMRLLYIEEF